MLKSGPKRALVKNGPGGSSRTGDHTASVFLTVYGFKRQLATRLLVLRRKMPLDLSSASMAPSSAFPRAANSERDPLGGWGAGTRRGRIARTSQPTLHHKKGMHKLQHWSCGSDAPTEAGGVGDAAARRGSATDAFVPSAPTAVCAHVSFPTRPPGVPPTAMARCATTVEVFTPHHQRTSRRRASARRKRRTTTSLPARAGFSCSSDARANALQFWGALVRPGARRGM